MKKSKKLKSQSQQQAARDVAEKALEITIKNTALDRHTIGALRLTCKRTKAAADAKVTHFSIFGREEPEAVQRSGLLNNITKLDVFLALRDSGDGNPDHVGKLSRALGLLHLAVDVCSNSVENLDATIYGSSDAILACGYILGTSDWESLQQLSMGYSTSMPGFLCGLIARPRSLPALKTLNCKDPRSADLEPVYKSVFIGNLDQLSIQWSDDIIGGCSTAPATVEALRNLLHNAKNLTKLWLRSGTFQYFDSDSLDCLKGLSLEACLGPTVDFAPVLARPWTTLETLELNGALLKVSDLICIFEAEDSMNSLKKVVFEECSFSVDSLSCVRRPHLETLSVRRCSNGHVLISQLAQLMKDGAYSLPSFREFLVHWEIDADASATKEAISNLLSCPCTAALESLTICGAEMGVKDTGLLCIIANNCHKLKYLNLQWNKFGKPAVALLLGYGQLGAWPELKRLDINQQYMEEDDPDYTEVIEEDDVEITEVFSEYMQTAEVEEILRRAWPALDVC